MKDKITEKSDTNDFLYIQGRKFKSRLLTGTGKFISSAAMLSAIEGAESEIVTVALRRIERDNQLDEQYPINHLDRKKLLLLPNTSGARTANEAVRLCRLARQLGGGDWIKLEVTPEPRYLLPDPVETFKAAEILVKENFVVLPYINADPILALRLQDIGCATVMPLASPIGSNQGLQTAKSIKIIIEQARVPVIVDAGIGAPSHAALAMEMGADAVLINTALAITQNPFQISHAFAMAVRAGRIAYLQSEAQAHLQLSDNMGQYSLASAKNSSLAETKSENMNEIEVDSKWKNAEASSPKTGYLN